MRFYVLALAAGIALAAPIQAEAAPLPASQGGPVAEQQQNFELVAGRCGRHARWIRGHRGRHGRWIKGHCVRMR